MPGDHPDTAWAVHKFGGTSLADASRYARAAELVRGARAAALREGTGDRGTPPVAVVVSAPAGVTDALLDAVARAAAGDPSYRESLAGVRQRVGTVARDLLADPAEPLLEAFDADTRDLSDVLRGVELTRTAPVQTAELVAGYGELWSARILHAHFATTGTSDARRLDAREVLVVRRGETGPVVLWDESRRRLAAWMEDEPSRCLVITGFVASDEAGVATSLGRNGSDFSASVFARLLDASSITIWTDVDGVMSADPRLVPDAVRLDHLSYDEAAELAYFGARVLHPRALAPAVDARIPVRIRDAGRPEGGGTTLSAAPTAETSGTEDAADGQDLAAPEDPTGERRSGDRRPPAVKGFSSSDDVALLNVEGMGLIGVPGVAQRLFGALRDVGVSVVLISQAGSEHSICAAVPAAQGEVARDAVERAFHAELHHGLVQTVEVDGPYRIVAAVGDGMVETPGVAARFFGALGASDINVRAIAQGASERNISAVVATRDASRALRAVHSGFYLPEGTLSVGLLGPGRIGSELLRQIDARSRALHDEFRIDLRVRGIMRSRTMLLDDRGIDLAEWEGRMEREGEPADLERFVAHVEAGHLPHAALVDCTATPAFNGEYPRWLDRGIHMVTANKHATSAGLDLYRAIRHGSHRAHYLGSATVGAGLPVIRTLRDLRGTGDRIRRIEGILSGTLSLLFDRLSPEAPFSRVVADAMERGYSEPDPREDLSGTDVMRKALILGRESGLPLEPSDVSVESLVPPDLRGEGTTVEAFLEALPGRDAGMEARRAEAESRGEVLRYVATVTDGEATVGLRSLPRDHPFAHARGADAMVAFTTDRYSPRPLVIQGPGAGPRVTAGGVFADLLRLAGRLGGGS